MSQNLPPSGHGDEEGRRSVDGPSFAKTGASHENPYYAGHQAQARPDLDSAAPVLDQNEMRRLNRKALIFLACILALVLTMVYWMMNRATSSDSTPPRARLQSAPKVPENMQIESEPLLAQRQQPMMPPVPVVDPQPQSAMPPLPDDNRVRAARSGPRPPTLLERRIAGLQGGGAGPSGAGAQRQAQSQSRSEAVGLPAVTDADNAMLLLHPDTLLTRGTYLRCVLETRIITTVEGFTSCVLTEPVYSFNGRNLLLPKGTKLLGSYKTDTDTMSDRVPVIWDRLVTPTGLNVNMASPGVDNLGGAGHPGDYNAHWPSRIMSALLISLISDGFKWAGAKHGPRSVTSMTGAWGTTIVDKPFDSTTANSMERLANQALSESARRKPTVTINQGTVVNVYVAKDVDFANVLAIQ